MSDPLEFGPDTGLRELWLFTLFVLSDEVAKWEPPRPGYPARDWPLEEALGAGPLDPAHVYVFEASDLGPGGLRHYLAGAHGMDVEQVEADAQKLDAIRGTVVLVLSGALKTRPGRFDPQPPVNFIAHFAEAQSLDLTPPQPAHASARGHMAPPPGPAGNSRALGRLFSITLAALALIALLVWAFA